jgi:hypothetical protein
MDESDQMTVTHNTKRKTTDPKTTALIEGYVYAFGEYARAHGKKYAPDSLADTFLSNISSEKVEELDRIESILAQRRRELESLEAATRDKTQDGKYTLAFSVPFQRPATLKKMSLLQFDPIIYGKDASMLMSRVFYAAHEAKNAPTDNADRPIPWVTVDGKTTRADLTIEAGYPVPQSTGGAFDQAHLLGAVEPCESCGAVDLLVIVIDALQTREHSVERAWHELSPLECKLPPFLVRKYRTETIQPIIAGHEALGANVKIKRFYSDKPTLTVRLDVTKQVYILRG